jgi:hypothetical protein
LFEVHFEKRRVRVHGDIIDGRLLAKRSVHNHPVCRRSRDLPIKNNFFEVDREMLFERTHRRVPTLHGVGTLLDRQVVSQNRDVVRSNASANVNRESFLVNFFDVELLLVLIDQSEIVNI